MVRVQFFESSFFCEGVFMLQRIKSFFYNLFHRTHLPSSVVTSNVPMRKEDTVQALLHEADTRGLLQESTLFARVKRFVFSFFKES